MSDAIFYKRKSTDTEDKQVLSLPSQDGVIRETTPGFSDFNLIADFAESKSAKAPGRPLFNQMCELLEAGKAQNIICWQLNRLARNPIDGGRIIWLVQNYGIKIVTPSKIYGVDDSMMMHIEFMMSNQFITDLRKNTKRGLNDKIRVGIAPIRACIGYFNDTSKPQGLRDILPDPARFALCRKMWDLFLTGNFTPPKILEIATNEWGLRQRNGKALSRSKIYEFFDNIFYTGKYIYAGEMQQGIHTPMVTMAEFEKAQKILHGTGKIRVAKRNYPYAGAAVKCICGSSVTMYERHRKICPQCHLKYNAEANTFCPKCQTPAPEKTWEQVYMICNRERCKTCKQSGISMTDFNKQMDAIISQVTVPNDFIDWTMNVLRRIHSEEAQGNESIIGNLQAALASNIRQENLLFEKFLSEGNAKGELIGDEEYKKRKEELKQTRLNLEEQIKAVGNKQDDWLNTAERVFNFVKGARYWLEHGTVEDRKTILAGLGLHPTLEGKILRLDLLKPIEVVGEAQKLLATNPLSIEPGEIVDGTIQNAHAFLQCPVWGDRRDSNPQQPAPQAGALPLSYDHHLLGVIPFLNFHFSFRCQTPVSKFLRISQCYR
jgi:site-specific DNA recombinase